MDNKCRICGKSAAQLFETGEEGVYACFRCQPLVPEVTIEGDDDNEDQSEQSASSKNGEDGELPYLCSICNKAFAKNAQLQNHVRNHRAERRFVCMYCQKAFSQSNNLRAHTRIHTNERPFKCNDCGKAFTQVTNLNNHVRLHTGERPFVCPEPGCDKAYAQVTNLNQHRKRHLNGRPVESTYDCNVCGEQFQQRNHMYSHKRAQHGTNKAFTCKLCDQQFPSERLLQKHVAQHVTQKDEGSSSSESESFTCVFSSCGAVLSSPRAHTEHLLSAHQLRVLAAPASTPAQPNKRGRPPKHEVPVDPLAFDPPDTVPAIKIVKTDVFRPKILKVESMFPCK